MGFPGGQPPQVGLDLAWVRGSGGGHGDMGIGPRVLVCGSRRVGACEGVGNAVGDRAES